MALTTDRRAVELFVGALKRAQISGEWWKRFLLPDLPTPTWKLLIDCLFALKPGVYQADTLFEAMMPYLSLKQSEEMADKTVAVLDKVFEPMGWGRRQDDTIVIHRLAFPSESPSIWRIEPVRLYARRNYLY